MQKIEYFLKTNNITILKKEFLDKVNILVELSIEDYKKITQEFPKNVIRNLEINIEKKRFISKKVREWILWEK